MRTILVLLILLASSLASAIDTPELSLRRGGANDGAVRLSRDAAGNLVLQDVYTSPTTLRSLALSGTAHAALAGLGFDDHVQYHTAGRHEAAHSQAFNAFLPIPTDGAGNATLGAHVLDDDLHLRRNDDEEVTGAWRFTSGITLLDEAITLGPGQFDSSPALRFTDAPLDAALSFDADAEAFRINRPLRGEAITVDTLLSGRAGGQRSAALEGFLAIEGIAPADLLASTRPESISAPWIFLSDVAAPRLVQPGLPAIVWKARNAGPAIAKGDALVWTPLSSSEELRVSRLAGLPQRTTPFAGFAAVGAANGGLVEVIVQGVVAAPCQETISAGQRVSWNGAAVVAYDAAETSTTLGFALEGALANQTIRLMIEKENATAGDP